MTKEEIQYKKMITTPTKKLIISLGVPATISMLVTAIYNIADTYFVGTLGEEVPGAVGVVFPLMAIIQAIGFTFGMGSGSIISSKLGERKEKEAVIAGASAFYVAILLGLVVMIITLLFNDPLMRFLGATENALKYSKDYAIYISIGFPIMCASFVMNNILRSEGKAKLAMIGLTTGGILNCFLDPLLIHKAGLGVIGASCATLISQSVSFLILLFMFISKKCIVKLSIKEVSLKKETYFEIIKIGLPSLFRQGLASIATMLLNKQAGLYGGDSALTAMTFVSKAFMIVFSVSLGIGQGYQPVCGYNYFAKKYKRVKEAMFFTYYVGTIFMTILSIIIFIYAKDVIRLFSDKYDNVINIGSKALRYQCVALPFLSLNVISNMTFQAIRKKTKATFLSSCRQGVFFIPIILILPLLFGITGVQIAQSLSDILTFLITIPFFVFFVKDLNRKIKSEL